MATPQYATVMVKFRNGENRPYRIYCSDAAGAVTWPDGMSTVSFPMDAKVTDIIFAATLATTPTLTVNKNAQPWTILNTATLTAATVIRPIQQAPIYLKAGEQFSIIQS